MKRNILSIMLACLMIVSLLVLTGCKVDDLAVKVDENAANAENAVNNAASKADADVKAAAKKAADDLAAAQAKLEKLIKDGDAADTASLAAAVKDFNAAIAAIDEALTGADAALKAELVADFDEKIETATKMLQEATNTAIGKATEELEAAIAKGDAATAAQLSDAIAAVAGKLANLDAVVQETAIALDDLLKAELSAAIEAVADAAAKNLADAKAALTDAIAAGDKVNADAIAALDAAVKAAQAAADAAAKANADLSAELKGLIDTAKADLQAEIKAVADDLAAKTAELNALIALKADSAAVKTTTDELAADLDALETVVAALSGDNGALADLRTYVDEKIAAAKAAADVAYIVVENWDAATELIIDAIVEISTHFNTKVDADFYYDDDYAIIVALYEEYRIRLTRAVDADAVDAVLNSDNGYYAAVETVDTKADVIYAVLTAEGKTADEVLLNDAWKKAIDDAQALLAAETDADVIAFLADVQKLADEMLAKYNALLGAKVEADLINADVNALIEMFLNDGWTFTAKDKSEAALKAIAAWDEAYGTANADLIDRKNVEKMNVASAEALAAYTKAAQALADKLAVYNADTYVFVYTADSYTAITALEAEYTAWAADVVARGFALDGEIEAPVAAAHTAFATGALARANALNTANTEATAIEAAIAALTEKLEKFTVVRSEYQVALEDIKADAKLWIETYFAAPYADIADTEKANYELLDHAAVAAVAALYEEKMGEVMRLAEALKAALAKLDTITVYSGADIEAAKAAYTAFTNWLADLAYEIEDLDTTDVITNTLATKTVEFKALVAEAVANYVTLDKVTLASGDKITAIKAWYNTYLALDITKADTELPVEKVVLSETLTIDAATLEAAKKAVADFDTLTAAKAAEFDALKAEIVALVAKNASTALRAEVDTALANYAAWLAGTKAPAGYTADQFIPVDATALDAEKADLDALNTAVEALEAAYKALQDRIALLVVDYKLIADTAAEQATLDTLKADIAAFIATNDNVDCFTDAEKKTLADAQTAIDRAVALAAIKADYNALIASLAGLDANVVANMTARADAAYAAAEAAIVAGDEAGIKLAEANFDLFAATIAEYNNALVAAGADATKAAKVYEAYVLLDAREDMVSADQLADELTIVAETFAAVLA